MSWSKNAVAADEHAVADLGPQRRLTPHRTDAPCARPDYARARTRTPLDDRSRGPAPFAPSHRRPRGWPTARTCARSTGRPPDDPVGDRAESSTGSASTAGRYANVAERARRRPASTSTGLRPSRARRLRRAGAATSSAGRDFHDDLEERLAALRAVQPGRPLVLYGHSLGGLIASGYVLSDRHAPAARPARALVAGAGRQHPGAGSARWRAGSRGVVPQMTMSNGVPRRRAVARSGDPGDGLRRRPAEPASDVDGPARRTRRSPSRTGSTRSPRRARRDADADLRLPRLGRPDRAGGRVGGRSAGRAT